MTWSTGLSDINTTTLKKRIIESTMVIEKTMVAARRRFVPMLNQPSGAAWWVRHILAQRLGKDGNYPAATCFHCTSLAREIPSPDSDQRRGVTI
eukprot:4515540-Amphidinium_carterae.1